MQVNLFGITCAKSVVARARKRYTHILHTHGTLQRSIVDAVNIGGIHHATFVGTQQVGMPIQNMFGSNALAQFVEAAIASMKKPRLHVFGVIDVEHFAPHQ